MAAELKKHMDAHDEKDAQILKLRAMVGNLEESHNNLYGEHTSARDTLNMLAGIFCCCRTSFLNGHY
jgi:hypothetical protein